jgi:hypothetical protein
VKLAAEPVGEIITEQSSEKKSPKISVTWTISVEWEP